MTGRQMYAFFTTSLFLLAGFACFVLGLVGVGPAVFWLLAVCAACLGFAEPPFNRVK